MAGPRAHRLRSRLLLLVLLAAVPEVAVVAWNVQQDHASDKAAAEHSALDVAAATAAALGGRLEGANTLLTGLDEVRELHVASPGCSEQLQDVLRQHGEFDNVAVADLGGNVSCSGRPLARSVNVANASWFRAALAKDDFAVGGYIVSPITGTPVVGAARPLRDRATDVGVVFAS